MSFIETVKTLSWEEKQEVYDFLRSEFEVIPEWQLEILKERSEKLASGESVPVPWEEAKQRLANLGK